VQEVLVDSERQYRRILGWVRVTQPEFVDRIKLYSDAVPLFERHGVDQAILSTLNKRVDLPSGGYLIFDYAEAFTVIDVNTGRFVGSSSRLEDTITKNNIEAAREVMRQLRLRDIGGIIVIDFIDMAVAKNRAEVLKVLQEELEHDRTKTYLVEISPLGLVEMTRQNVTAGVRETLTRICPTCGGEGRVLSEQTMSVEAERRLRKVARGSGAEAFFVRMNARVATHLAGPGGTKLLELERETGKFFTIEPVERMSLSEVEVVREGMRVDVDGDALPVAAGDELKIKISEPHMYNTTDGVARVNGGYGIVIAGAIGYVGQDHRIRIERASRTGAFATLIDAKPTAFELEPEPEYSYELPEMEREVGERLELEERSRPRRTRQTAAKSRTAKAKPEPAGEEAAAEDGAAPEADETPAKKPAARRRSRAKKAEPDAAAEAEAVAQPGEPEPVAEEDGEGGDGAEEPGAATRRRRRGKRGGRGRSKAAAAAAADGGAADGDAADAAPDVVAAEPAPEPVADAEVKPKPRRRRTPTKARPAEPAAEEPAPAPPEPPQPAAEPPPADDGRKGGGILGRLLGS
jgi:ribonuclease G